MKRSLVVLAVACLVLSACGGSGGLAVQDAWARPASADSNGAVYMLVSNGGADDVLLGASADVARAVEIHETMAAEDEMDMDDEEGMDHSEHMSGSDDMGMDTDVMQMAPVDSLAIPSGDEVAFAPGGYHVMLIDLQMDLVEGESSVVTLHFEQAGDIEVEVVVEQR